MIVTATYATPQPDEWPSRLDRTISAGFDPHPDDMLPPAQHLLAGEGVDPLTAFAAEVEAVRHACDAPDCGTRCHDCNERMTCMGPDARACGVTCWSCPCDCTACLRQRQDMRDELISQLERESR